MCERQSSSAVTVMEQRMGSTWVFGAVDFSGRSGRNNPADVKTTARGQRAAPETKEAYAKFLSSMGFIPVFGA